MARLPVLLPLYRVGSTCLMCRTDAAWVAGTNLASPSRSVQYTLITADLCLCLGPPSSTGDLHSSMHHGTINADLVTKVSSQMMWLSFASCACTPCLAARRAPRAPVCNRRTESATSRNLLRRGFWKGLQSQHITRPGCPGTLCRGSSAKVIDGFTLEADQMTHPACSQYRPLAKPHPGHTLPAELRHGVRQA